MNDPLTQAQLTEAATHRNAGRIHEAELIYKAILDRIPMQPDALFMLGVIGEMVGQTQKAVWYGLGAVQGSPNRADFWNGLGAWHRQNGELLESVAAFRKAVELAPNIAEYHSNLIFAMHYRHDAGEIAAECERWEAAHGNVIRCRHSPSLRLNRPLKIGFVSHDLGMHSVSFFLLPFLKNIDRRRFHVTCFSGPQDDAVTKLLKTESDDWHVIADVPDKPVSRLIRNLGIDVLVDLSGHTAKNRLTLFAHKPAPVQVSWLGFPGDTGLSAIDFRITDAITDPWPFHPGADGLIRLPETAWCFSPLSGSPAVSPLPAVSNGFITFGCLSHIAKITPLCIEMWSLILHRTPNSRLLLKSSSFRAPEVMERFKADFARWEIAADRVEMLPDTIAPLDHITTYDRIDIALDTFPYNGTTTTCEALWMGVPVVTIRGNRHASRVGASLLHSMGMDGMVGADALEYVETATALASDVTRLADVRANLRERMQGSALMDGAAFARGMEAAISEAWATYSPSSTNTKARAISQPLPQ